MILGLALSMDTRSAAAGGTPVPPGLNITTATGDLIVMSTGEELVTS